MRGIPVSGSAVASSLSGYWTEYKDKLNNSEVSAMAYYLYEVTVVDQGGSITLDKKVVAKDEESAKFKAGVYRLLEEESLNPEDVTIVASKGHAVKVKDR
ncbi:hypothetical protein [Paenibacillus xylaniclasticus]|uniref:hypothetical protein n=1 Tax=Paenibacillus xylaniclasticus TaxID=588083 RepID=UPI000FDACEAB|nr:MULTISPECIES: hypothetical protein [Paenibacillus]GFN32498.1 hypothetical protein PCURB6_27580 [Paenibacillus curdlanolyticus]